MIKLTQIKLPITHSEKDLTKAIIKSLKLPSHFDENKLTYKIMKKSIDARHDDAKFIYSINVSIENESQILKRVNNKNVMLTKEEKYQCLQSGAERLSQRPIIIGSGPAGLFCAYLLSINGYRPLVIERGEPVEQRTKTVENFFRNNILNPESNVQFGEGGAGTFSDGKLNTLVKDKFHRNDFVLDTFIKFGADESIRYLNKPHIGTDILSKVVRNMRNESIKYGAEFLFNTKFIDYTAQKDKISSIEIETSNGQIEHIECDVLVLALGHSARDTFKMLNQKTLLMEPKSFAVGVRVEHPQEQINTVQYGSNKDILPAADYKLAENLPDHRGVYSFCMCPGGYVVNSSSEKGMTAVNGMSYSKRDGINANSAIIVTVTPDDFPEKTPIGGIIYQQNLEKLAYQEGKSKIPVQLFSDFKQNVPSKCLGEVIPQTKGEYELSNVRRILPEYISNSLITGINLFSNKIKDYNRPDAIISGVETRTSSPLRIIRNEDYESNIGGIYPCGEGAGYAGGITSAAMDGIKIYEAITKKFAPFDR